MPGARERSYNTEGVVLRRRNLGEADSIFTVFSPTVGKFDGVARGAVVAGWVAGVVRCGTGVARAGVGLVAAGFVAARAIGADSKTRTRAVERRRP